MTQGEQDDLIAYIQYRFHERHREQLPELVRCSEVLGPLRPAVAEQLGISPEASRARLSRGLKQLRIELRAEEEV